MGMVTLDARSETTSEKRNTNRFRRRRLATAAGALAGAGAAESAKAGIHYDLSASAGPGDSIYLTQPSNPNYSTARIDLFSSSSMGMQDLSLGGNGNSPNGSAQFVGQAGLDSMGMAGMGGMAYHALSELSVGSTVDGSLSTDFHGQPFGYLVRENVVATGWNAGNAGYAGFEFTYDGASAYGWMKINFSGSSFTVEEWAFDNTGAAIEVGAIPEPGTALLLGLGLAGVAMVGRRARRFAVEKVDGVRG